MTQIDVSSKYIRTVTGAILPDQLGITDAHNHLWIEPVGATGENLPYLTDFDLQRSELEAFYKIGGRGQVDCQPGYAGRNGNRLFEFSTITKVNIIACTGFHLKKYYPSDTPFWNHSLETLVEYFNLELTESLIETRNSTENIQAGCIKVACESTLKASPLTHFEAAALVAKMTGAPIEIHTEKGADVENILDFFLKLEVSPLQLIFCHMDKRPDFMLHSELAKEGVGLEYDTFYRSKYHPEENVWWLIERLCGVGLDSSIILASDMAEIKLWKEMGTGPGLTGFITQIGGRLHAMGLKEEIIKKIMGMNIANRLAFLDRKLI